MKLRLANYRLCLCFVCLSVPPSPPNTRLFASSGGLVEKGKRCPLLPLGHLPSTGEGQTHPTHQLCPSLEAKPAPHTPGAPSETKPNHRQLLRHNQRWRGLAATEPKVIPGTFQGLLQSCPPLWGTSCAFCFSLVWGLVCFFP